MSNPDSTLTKKSFNEIHRILKTIYLISAVPMRDIIEVGSMLRTRDGGGNVSVNIARV